MRTYLTITLVLIATLALAACGSEPAAISPAAEQTVAAAPLVTSAPTAAAEPTAAEPAAGGVTGAVKVAVMGPFTGGAAAIGQEQLNFAKLAVEDFNAQNGTNYELVEADTELDPAKAVDVAQRLAADENVYAIVGPAGSQEVIAVAPVLDPASLAYVSPSATRTDLTESNFAGFFRVVPRDDVQGSTDANFMAEQLQAQSVWLIDDQTAYSTGLADAVEQVLTDKGVAVTRESITQTDSDFSALVTRLKGEAPDVVFIPWQLAPQAAVFAKQMAEQGVSATIFGADGLFDAQNFIDSAAGATEGAYVSFFAPDVRSVEAAQPVVEAYQSQFGGEVGPFGAPTYVATMVALDSIRRAEQTGTLTRASVLAAVPETNMETSILGIPIKFDDKGDIENANFFLFQVKDGAFTLVQQSQ